jgi:hypothetical protein
MVCSGNRRTDAYLTVYRAPCAPSSPPVLAFYGQPVYYKASRRVKYFLIELVVQWKRYCDTTVEFSRRNYEIFVRNHLLDITPTLASTLPFSRRFSPRYSLLGMSLCVVFVFSGILGVVVGLIGYLVPVVRQVETRLPDYDASPTQAT